jgi:DNA-binding GntR family transcriptional regulator
VADTKIDILAEKLRERINGNEFGTSGRIPPHRVLAEQLETTRETINKVIQLLQSEGLLVARDKSVYVQKPLLKLPGFLANFEQYIRDRGKEPVTEFLETPDLVPLQEPMAKMLGRSSGEMVPHRLLRQGVKYTTGIVYYRWSENFYNPDLIKDEIFATLQSDAQFDTWVAMKEKYGIEVLRAKNTVTARLPTLPEQAALEIVRGTPVLEVDRIQIAQDDLIVMVNKIVYVGSLFELSFATEVSR